VSPPYVQGLNQSMERMREKYPKSKPIRFSELGKTDGIDDSYMWYRMLSSDSAHPSLSSLARYFERHPDNVLQLLLLPAQNTQEEEDTLQFAAEAALGVCVATCQICSVPIAHQALSPLFDEFLTLARRSSAQIVE
jgi:hypothetical protein